jgi:integrase
MARGRKADHFRTSDGTTILGLIHQRDGRYRVLATGQRFTAASETEAIATYRRLSPQQETIDVPITSTDEMSDSNNIWFMSNRITGSDFWPWLRELLVTRLGQVADKTGLPGLATLDLTKQPQSSPKLASIRDLYDTKNEANWRTKGQVKAAFARLRQITGAKTLDDLTTEALITFREAINSQLAPTGAAQVFSKIKSALSFAAKYGQHDAEAIAKAIARAKALYAPRSNGHNKPTPMSTADFRTLLQAADTQWRAILLLAMNMALYAEDICELRWADFNLDAGTYTGQRQKTSVVRVGCLWPETLTAIKALPRKGESPYLFTSKTGTRYMATTLYDVYKDLRESVGVTTPFSGLRDAAYTIACEKCDERIARVFAAHKAAGLLDAYVQRRPEFVKPATDAIREAFGPFPFPHEHHHLTSQSVVRPGGVPATGGSAPSSG